MSGSGFAKLDPGIAFERVGDRVRTAEVRQIMEAVRDTPDSLPLSDYSQK